MKNNALKAATLRSRFASFVKNSKKKNSLAILSMLTLSATLGLAIYIFNTTQPIVSPVQQKMTGAPIYYFAKDWVNPERTANNFKYSFVFIDPSSETTNKETLITPWDFTVNSYDSNMPFQFAADGKRFVYGASDRSDPHGPPAKSNSFHLNIGIWGQEPRTIIKNSEPEEFTDWKLTADGKELVYIMQVTDNKDAHSASLFSVNFDSGQTTNIGVINRPADRENTKLIEVESEQSLRFYTAEDDGIYETRYSRPSGKITRRKVVDKSRFEWGSMDSVSPDGQKMVYTVYSETAGVIVYLMDLNTGNVTTLLKNHDPKVGYDLGYWSPDNKSLLISTSPNGGDAQEQKGFKNQLFILNTETGETQIVVENSSPGGLEANGASTYITNSWSPDGRFITYVLNKNLYFYDLQNKELLEKITTNIGDGFDSQSAFGWFSQ